MCGVCVEGVWSVCGVCGVCECVVCVECGEWVALESAPWDESLVDADGVAGLKAIDWDTRVPLGNV